MRLRDTANFKWVVQNVFGQLKVFLQLFYREVVELCHFSLANIAHCLKGPLEEHWVHGLPRPNGGVDCFLWRNLASNVPVGPSAQSSK